MECQVLAFAGDLQDLINDNIEEEEEEEDEEVEKEVEERKKKRKKRAAEEDQLEEEDFDLIAENTGIQLPKKKFRRVRTLDSDEEEEEQEEEAEKEESEKRSIATRVSRELEEVFAASDDEDDVSETRTSVQTGRRPASGAAMRVTDDALDEDVDDFIVGDDGRPLRQKKGDDYSSEPALLEAQDVFGLDFDPAEFERFDHDDTGADEEEIVGQDEDEYESEGEGEVTKVKPKRVRKEKKKKNIFDVYEPSELEAGHMTEKDAEIRVTDIPERFQLRNIPVQRTDDVYELDEEAKWVYEQMYCSPPISKQIHYGNERPGVMSHGGQSKQQSTVPKIKEALNFMRNHFFEVPFIANYRKEYISPELDIYDLWRIWQLDEKWLQLCNRKKNMKRLFERMQDYQYQRIRDQPDAAVMGDHRVLQEQDMARLEAVKSHEELSDVYTHFSFYYSQDLIAMQNKQAGAVETMVEEVGAEGQGTQTSAAKKLKHTVKTAYRKDFYTVCRENGLGSLAAKFGLTSEQFGENLRDNYQRHETSQHHAEPEDAGEEYKQPAGNFNTVRAVLQGACHMVAMEIAHEPLVRQALRQVFRTRAVLHVRPTKKGKKLIDESHPCNAFKYLKNKPVRDLRGDDFLKIEQAESENLIDVKVSIDIDYGSEKRNTASHTYLEEVRTLFYRDEFSSVVEKWNAQRALAVTLAIQKVLFPIMEKELRQTLLQEAKEHVLRSCAFKFRQMLDIAPYPVLREDAPSNSRARVMACAYLPDRTVPSFLCFLDEAGEVVDFRKLKHLLKRKNSPYEIERKEKEEDMKTIRNFLNQRRPDVIVVAAESLEATHIMEDLKSCVLELEQEENFPSVPIELMDPNVARIFSNSRRGKEQFRDYPELLKMAVSLGRRIREPLEEFTAMFMTEDEEILSLKLHPLQDAVNREQMKLVLEMELVSRVNDVGVDINYCLEHSHIAPAASFVCGLGPRKAAALMKILKQENSQLQNRSQLVTQCSIGPQVFINCAGFLRIKTHLFTDTDTNYIEVLDSTRIHPETYEWARKMAVDALEYDETGDEPNPSGAVEEILETPEKLKDLDLDAFAEELERQDYGNKRTTLYDIRDELFGPYKERRKPFVSMSQEEKFTLLTGESMEALREGKLVTCTVIGILRRKLQKEVMDRATPIKNEETKCWQCPFCLKDDFREISLVWQHFDDGSCPGQGIGVRTRLENGLSGFILTKNLSDKHVNAPEERVKVGMTLQCRILRVNLDKFSVDLTCRSSDLVDKDGKFSAPRDTYYDIAAAEADKKKEEAIKQQPQQTYVKRVIVHPSFKNCTFAEAERLLMSMDQGEAIFRPSSKGPDHLTVTWKVDTDILQHIDIQEQDKPTQFSIGKTLKIGSEVFEDLDEILARYIQPMAANARDLLTNKCYRAADGGNKDILRKILAEEKHKNPKRIPYFFSACKQCPGKFILAYQPGTRPYFEMVSLQPEGLQYRNKVHRSVNELVKWFKEHYKDPIPKPVVPSSPAVSTVMGMVDPGMLSNLQAAIQTVHQHRGVGDTPYTPSQWIGSTPTPQFPSQSQQTAAYPQQVVFQQGQAPFAVGGQYQFAGGSGVYHQRGSGGWNQAQGSWSSSGSRTPSQTPGRTPGYAPSPRPPSSHSHGYGRSSYNRRKAASPSGTPVMDE